MGIFAVPIALKFVIKGLTNEKRGGLKVVAFDRSPFKLFTQRFLNKLVQAPSLSGLKLLILNQKLFPNNGIVKVFDTHLTPYT